MPFTYGGRVDQHVNRVELGREGNLAILQLLHPVLVEQDTEVLVEWPRVGQETAADQNIAHKSAHHENNNDNTDRIAGVDVSQQRHDG